MSNDWNEEKQAKLDDVRKMIAEANAKNAKPAPGKRAKRSTWVRKDGTSTENGEARALTAWMRAENIFFARCPNEGSIGNGPLLFVLKATGLVKGCPDYLIFDRPKMDDARAFSATGGVTPFRASGVALELKAEIPAKGTKPAATPEQLAFLRGLEERGWITLVCFGSAQAIRKLKELGLGKSALLETGRR